MPRYSEERKAAVLSKLLPPINRTVVSASAEEGITEGTLYYGSNFIIASNLIVESQTFIVHRHFFGLTFILFHTRTRTNQIPVPMNIINPIHGRPYLVLLQPRRRS